MTKLKESLFITTNLATMLKQIDYHLGMANHLAFYLLFCCFLLGSVERFQLSKKKKRLIILPPILVWCKKIVCPSQPALDTYISFHHVRRNENRVAQN